ncbi:MULTISPECIES: hypothetical protein [unclassified Spirillospora]|uniref:hypothetical protein n=1 Tax=unclassified Spirillospora TaxID=2642701 RepID=UPI0037136800
MKRRVVKGAALAILAVCVLLVSVQCGAAGGSPGGGSAARGGRGFNATDVMFLQMMLPTRSRA